MKLTLLISCVVLALGCTAGPEPVWCTGEGTRALVRDTSSYITEAWSMTDHPNCDTQVRGHVVDLEDLPTPLEDPEDYAAGPPAEELTLADAVMPDGILTLVDTKPALTYGISLDMGDWGFDKEDPSTFYLGGGDWVLLDEKGEPYLRCRFDGQLYRLYLEREPS